MTSDYAKAAQNPMTEGRDWSALLLETIDEVLFSVDREWRFTSLNRQASVLWGKPSAALLGLNMWEAFPTLQGTGLEQFYRQAMDATRPTHYEAFSPITHVWYSVRAYPIPQGLIIAFQDITARKQAELALQQQADRARVQAAVSQALAHTTYEYQTTLDTAAQQLAEHIGDGCIIRLITDDGEWFQFAASHHRDPEAAAFVRDMLLGTRHQRVNEGLVGRVVQTGQSVCIPTISSEELKAFTRPEHWSYLDRFPVTSTLITPLRAAGRVIGIIAMNRDTAGRPYTNEDQVLVQDLADRVAIAIMNARLFQQVQMSEARFKTLSEASYEALFIHDNGVIIEANQRTAEMYGYARDELIGKSIYEFIAPESLATLQEHLSVGDEFTGETISIRRDGSRFITESRGKPLAYQGRQVRLVALRDITDLKQAEAELRTTQAQLLQSQKMESMGQLAGGIAHDFNNLLNVIIGYCGLITQGLAESDPVYADVREILHAGQRAAALVRQILAFSRRQILQPDVVNLNTVVANLDTLLHRVLGVDIDVLTLLDPDLASVLVDPSQIEQVIVNLAVNARDAMPDGGHLTIETANVTLDEQYRSTNHPEVKTGAYVMIAVSDTGVGMDQATQAKIFEPFFTTKEPGKGTGLGLATVYGIVRQSEGYIWVYSEPGIGTTFKIYLPSVADQPHETTQHASEMHAPYSIGSACLERPGSGRTILVVEDEQAVNDLIVRVLTEAGYTVREAYNGQMALDILAPAAHQIDLVLTDMVMPEMGGRALIEQLKVQWAKLPVLCMSGYTDHSLQRHQRLRPCDAFLQKPFTPEALLRRIAEMITTDDEGPETVA